MNNIWHINIPEERDFISKNDIETFILKPDNCPIYNKGIIGIKTQECINNPLQWKFNNYKCYRNLSIGNWTIFEKNPHVNISFI